MNYVMVARIGFLGEYDDEVEFSTKVVGYYTDTDTVNGLDKAKSDVFEGRVLDSLKNYYSEGGMHPDDIVRLSISVYEVKPNEIIDFFNDNVMFWGYYDGSFKRVTHSIPFIVQTDRSSVQ